MNAVARYCSSNHELARSTELVPPDKKFMQDVAFDEFCKRVASFVFRLFDIRFTRPNKLSIKSFYENTTLQKKLLLKISAERPYYHKPLRQIDYNVIYTKNTIISASRALSDYLLTVE